MATPSEHLAAQFAALVTDADTRTGPIQMINMIRFRDTANYSEGDIPEGGIPTGAEAYATYGQLATPFVAKAGGGRVWSSRDSTVVVGPASERWDAVFAVRYPNRKAFIDMVTDPGYRAVAHHRAAAVADSRLIMIEVAET